MQTSAALSSPFSLLGHPVENAPYYPTTPALGDELECSTR